MSPPALVTGACGFTGGTLVDHLVETHREVVATDLVAASRVEFYG